MILHANAVAKNGAAAVWARGIHGNNADCPILFPVVFGQFIYEGTLPCSRRTGKTEDAGMSGVREECFE